MISPKKKTQKKTKNSSLTERSSFKSLSPKKEYFTNEKKLEMCLTNRNHGKNVSLQRTSYDQNTAASRQNQSCRQSKRNKTMDKKELKKTIPKIQKNVE